MVKLFMIRLITGCSRAGSKFTYKLLRQLGLDMRHEGMGKDGTCSHYANGLSMGYPEIYESLNFDVVFLSNSIFSVDVRYFRDFPCAL